ncbi:hypothetical protein F5880DRAFT_1610980 [Lentinula raphanica]|nr:hypothetical protein F5880DRAFT_1610980 [Lentinula raphanica]
MPSAVAPNSSSDVPSADDDASGSNMKSHSVFYPNAASDFYGTPSRPLCVYKSGDLWPVHTGLESERIIREARPVYDHPMQDNWPEIGERLYTLLDDNEIRWTSIDPLAFAEAGEEPFCPLLLWIGVEPASLGSEDAQTVAEAATFLLASFGFQGIEIGFRESVVTRSQFSSKMLSYDSPDPFPELRKPFTPILGLPIALQNFPHFEGTGALYLRPCEKSDIIYLLTCAHVVRPLRNTDTHWSKYPRLSHKVIALGQMGYNNAVKGIQDRIAFENSSIALYEELGDKNGESKEDMLVLAQRSKQNKRMANDLHSTITKHWTDVKARVIGRVDCAPPVGVHGGFTEDWALIELENDKFNLTTFKGNQVYVDKKSSPAEYAEMMYPNVKDRANFTYPKNDLLQAYGVVPADEIRKPQHLDRNGNKCMFVVKNGLATGTTFGRCTGMESFTRVYYMETKMTAKEIAVLPYSNKEGPFSDKGDSGSIVLTRDGSILGMITGGAGCTNATDVSYLTPFWFILEQIRKAYPNCHLY